MHPAPSLVVFTVLSGAGLGMIVWIACDFGPVDHQQPWIAALIAIALTAAGGLASIGHLAKPSNAWRAFSQWRSSWLSREACFMAGSLAVFGLHVGLWGVFGIHLDLLGWIAGALALAAIYATAMIYAQLATVPTWSATPTVPLFLAVALAGGILALTAAEALAGRGWPRIEVFVLLVAAAAMAVRWQTAAAGAGRLSQGTTLATATGLGRAGRVRVFEAPHTGSNYLLDEMAYRVARKRAWQLRLVGAGLGFLLPLVLAVLGIWLGAWALVPALLAHLAGMMALRWLFFAEAQHVQAIYYGGH